MDIISEFDDIYTEDGVELSNQWITEAQEGATKKNIFQRLWELIKKFFSWIAKKLTQLWKWLVSKFKKKSKTADQCVVEVIGIETFEKGKNNRSSKKNKNAAKDDKVIDATVKEVPKHESADTDKTIKDISKNILVQFNDDNTFSIYYKITSEYDGSHDWLIKAKPLGNKNIPGPGRLTNDIALLGLITFGALTYHEGTKRSFSNFVESWQNRR